jgi:hypothetical protein
MPDRTIGDEEHLVIELAGGSLVLERCRRGPDARAERRAKAPATIRGAAPEVLYLIADAREHFMVERAGRGPVEERRGRGRHHAGQHGDPAPGAVMPAPRGVHEPAAFDREHLVVVFTAASIRGQDAKPPVIRRQRQIIDRQAAPGGMDDTRVLVVLVIQPPEVVAIRRGRSGHAADVGGLRIGKEAVGRQCAADGEPAGGIVRDHLLAQALVRAPDGLEQRLPGDEGGLIAAADGIAEVGEQQPLVISTGGEALLISEDARPEQLMVEGDRSLEQFAVRPHDARPVRLLGTMELAVLGVLKRRHRHQRHTEIVGFGDENGRAWIRLLDPGLHLRQTPVQVDDQHGEQAGVLGAQLLGIRAGEALDLVHEILRARVEERANDLFHRLLDQL